MKKFFVIAALMAIMLVASSATNRGFYKIAPGSIAPMLTVNDSEKSFDLASLRGRYVLLSFWSSTDAPSRESVNRYSKALRNMQDTAAIAHIAVNFDSSHKLFEEVVKRDGLDAKAQFNASSSQPEKIIANFNLTSGYGSVLIGPDGKIIEVNPGISNLTRIRRVGSKTRESDPLV